MAICPLSFPFLSALRGRFSHTRVRAFPFASAFRRVFAWRHCAFDEHPHSKNATRLFPVCPAAFAGFLVFLVSGSSPFPSLRLGSCPGTGVFARPWLLRAKRLCSTASGIAPFRRRDQSLRTSDLLPFVPRSRSLLFHFSFLVPFDSPFTSSPGPRSHSRLPSYAPSCARGVPNPFLAVGPDSRPLPANLSQMKSARG